MLLALFMRLHQERELLHHQHQHQHQQQPGAGGSGTAENVSTSGYGSDNGSDRHQQSTEALSSSSASSASSTTEAAAREEYLSERLRRLSLLPTRVSLDSKRICLVRAERDFAADHWSKLSLTAGELLLAHENDDYNERWWTGYKDDGKSGVLPRDAISIVLDDPLSRVLGVASDGSLDDSWVECNLTPTPARPTSDTREDDDRRSGTTGLPSLSPSLSSTSSLASSSQSASTGEPPGAAPVPRSVRQSSSASSLDDSFVAIASPARKDSARRVAMSGYLLKKGASAMSWQTWQRRWFVLDRVDNRLYYSIDKDSPTYRGFINISDITTVHPSFFHGTRKEKGDWPFEIHTPDREWLLQASSQEERTQWIDVINQYAHSRHLATYQYTFASIPTESNNGDADGDGDGDGDLESDWDQGLDPHFRSTDTTAVAAAAAAAAAAATMFGPAKVVVPSPIGSSDPSVAAQQASVIENLEPGPNGEDPFANFGARDGEEVANKYSILPQIDRALGHHSPPAVEYIFVEPYLNSSGPLFKVSANPYGHASVRYTLPNGRHTVWQHSYPHHCHYALSLSLSLQLSHTQTLMAGDEHCGPRQSRDGQLPSAGRVLLWYQFRYRDWQRTRRHLQS